MVPDQLLRHMNTLWSVLIVSELVKSGIDTYFVSPGNRNVPIMAALASVEGVVAKFSMDERASAYRAMGHAKAAGVPGVLVCTSGTAAANYYPAVIESFRDEIPIIVWSADRPPELVAADANQTIEQAGIFGRFVRKSLHLPCPSPDFPLQALLSEICDMAAVKNGPVHINLPFREPLLPPMTPLPDADPVQTDLAMAARQILENPHPHTCHADAADFLPTAFLRNSPGVQRIRHILSGCKRGLVVAGRTEDKDDPETIQAFAEKRKWPVYCDIAAMLKGRLPENAEIPFLDHPDALALVLAYDPDVIIQFGAGLVSKAYYEKVLKKEDCPPKLIQITTKTGIRDPSHAGGFRLGMTAKQAVSIIGSAGIAAPDASAVSELVTGFRDLTWQVSQNTPDDLLSHPLIAKTIYGQVPENEALFAGNSLVVRAFDMVAPAAGRKIDVVTNRGVSGIEGNIATAVGYAESAGRRVTAVIGDISFLHDLNSLMLISESNVPVVILVINNRGGRIFERLPVAGFDGIPMEWVTMPHPYNFQMAAGLFNIPYWEVGTPGDLKEAYREALGGNCSALIEIRLSPEADLEVYRARNFLPRP
ncbi:MAG: 2-succinyl-5-enolpyruvyl-6-hydroxy-3-cyclohexene-1-carboxylic-acid synthase [Thermodesulfobacteriota bacterium]